MTRACEYGEDATVALDQTHEVDEEEEDECAEYRAEYDQAELDVVDTALLVGLGFSYSKMEADRIYRYYTLIDMV